MKRLRSRFLGRNLVSVLAAVVVLSLSLTVTAHAAVLFSDDFSGTAIDTSKWMIHVASGASGQFTENSGLYYQGSSGSDVEALVTSMTFSGGVQATVKFSNFSSTTTYPSSYNGSGSYIDLGMGPATDRVDILLYGNNFGMSGVTGMIVTGLFDHSNPSIPVPLAAPMTEFATATDGKFSILYNGSVVTTYYDGALLGTFSPGWSGPQPFLIVGGDAPNGTTSFEVTKFKVSSVPLPPALLLLGPGLLGLAALRRRFKK